MPVAVNDKGDVLALGDDGQWSPAKVAVNPKTGQKLAYDGKDWVEYGKPGFFRRVDDSVRALARGATLGYADEIGAGLNATVASPFNDKSWKQNYDENLTEQRRLDANFDATNPALSTGLQIAGGVGSAIAAPPLKGMGVAGRALAEAPRYLRYGLLGAAGGGAAGFGDSEGGLDKRLEGGQTGAILGGITGAALPYVGDFIGSAARKVMNMVGARTGAPNAAARKIAQAAADDDTTAEQIGQRLGKLGKGATIADAGGPNVRGLAEQAANQPGVAQRLAQRTMEPRTSSMGGRIYESARENLGARGDFYGTADDLMAQRAKDAAPLYQKAYARQIEPSETINSLMSRPAMKDALGRAGAIAAEEGQGEFAKLPSMQTLDYVKRGLDDVLEGYRDSVTGKLRLDERGRAIDATRRAFLSELDNINPDYKAARAAWGGPTAAKDAMMRGRNFARGDEEVTAKILRDLPESERTFFREGALQEIKSMMDASADGIDKARKLINTPRIRDALREVFPDNASWGRFKMTLLAETKKAQTRNEVLKGSQTARRLAGQDQANIDVGGPITEAFQGNFANAGRGLWSNITRSLTKMPAPERERLGQMLFSTDPQAQREALRMMGSQAQMLGINQARKALTAAGFGGARNVTSGLLADQGGY